MGVEDTVDTVHTDMVVVMAAGAAFTAMTVMVGTHSIHNTASHLLFAVAVVKMAEEEHVGVEGSDLHHMLRRHKQLMVLVHVGDSLLKHSQRTGCSFCCFKIYVHVSVSVDIIF